MHHLLGVRRVASVLLVALLAACSSGGDGDDRTRSTEIVVSTNSITFSADAPDADTPAAQTITATFGSDVAHLAVIHNGRGIANVTSEISGRTATINVEPTAPSAIGSGIFTGSIAITGYFCADASCTSLAAGNTETITVSYQISPVIISVAPYVGIADKSASAILRGVGFASFATQGVRLGTIQATEFTVSTDSLIRFTYPALEAGSYDVQIDIPTHEGDIDSAARLVIVEPTDYAAEALDYPESGAVRRIIYDAERSAILVGTDADGGTILRYAFADGAWQAPEIVALDDLQDFALSIHGDRLLAITRDSFVPLDATTLELGAEKEAPSLASGHFLKNIAVTNNDQALITTGRNENATSPLYVYVSRQDVLTQLSSTVLNNATPVATDSGSTVLFMQGHSSTTNQTAVIVFSATTGEFDVLPTQLRQNEIPPLVDRDGTRAILNGRRVHGEGFDLLGLLPETTLAVAINREGTRAYTYDSEAGGILTFDITEDISDDTTGEEFTPEGPAEPLVANPGTGPRMAISPDGNTLFIAGNARVVIHPTPDL